MEVPPALTSFSSVLASMWTRGTGHLQFSAMMDLRERLKSIRGMRRALTEDEKHKIEEKIVAHLESTNWKFEKGPPSAGQGRSRMSPGAV
jgi:hypothetical protein